MASAARRFRGYIQPHNAAAPVFHTLGLVGGAGQGIGGQMFTTALTPPMDLEPAAEAVGPFLIAAGIGRAALQLHGEAVQVVSRSTIRRYRR